MFYRLLVSSLIIISKCTKNLAEHTTWVIKSAFSVLINMVLGLGQDTESLFCFLGNWSWGVQLLRCVDIEIFYCNWVSKQRI